MVTARRGATHPDIEVCLQPRRIARAHMMPVDSATAGAPTADPPISADWQAALDGFDADLRRRAVAPKPRPPPRHAHPSATIQFAAWGTARALAPAAVDVRALRRYVAGLSASGQAPTTVA